MNSEGEQPQPHNPTPTLASMFGGNEESPKDQMIAEMQERLEQEKDARNEERFTKTAIELAKTIPSNPIAHVLST